MMMIAVSGVSYAKCFPSRKSFLSVENFHAWDIISIDLYILR